MAASTISADIPHIGLGTWKIAKGCAANVVYESIKLGIRHLDCACDYGNEVEVGMGIQKAIADGLLTRKDLFITSKLWNTYHSSQHVEMALKKSLDDLQLEYLDLYLIHFPISQRFVPFEERYPPEWVFDPSSSNPKIELDLVPYKETWQAMEAVQGKGLTRLIGVCNLNVQSLMDILSYATIVPSCNQVELHPYLTQQPLVDFCQSRGITVVGFSPLGSPSYVELGMDQGLRAGVLNEPVVLDIAKKYSKTPAQVVLRWNTQRGVIVIPKSSSLDRILENFSIFDFELQPDEVSAISQLNKNLRFNDPGEFCKGMGGSIPIYA